MDHAIRRRIEECAHESHAGRLVFPSVVATLAAAGVESYHADFRRRTNTYYLADGQTLEIELPAPDIAIPRALDGAAQLAAIRAAQRDEVRYPEFMRRSMAAGCVGYVVWIGGRHVTYFGRSGEEHDERFPQPA